MKSHLILPTQTVTSYVPAMLPQESRPLSSGIDGVNPMPHVIGLVPGKSLSDIPGRIFRVC